MAKTIKISVVCPQCATKMVMPVTEPDLGTKKPGHCPNCHKKFQVPIPTSLASKFESDPTEIGGAGANDMSLLLETVQNEFTGYPPFSMMRLFFRILSFCHDTSWPFSITHSSSFGFMLQ